MKSAKREYRQTVRAQAAEATALGVIAVAYEQFTEKPYDIVSLQDIADAAGVAVRTVIRRFGSKEELFVTAMNHFADEMMRQRDAAPVGDVAGAVRNLVDHYERWGHNRLRMLSQEDRIPVVRDNVARGRGYHRKWVERTFAPLLVGLGGNARKRRVLALIVATDVYTWKLLRLDLGLSRAQTEQIIGDLVKGDAS